MRRRQRVGADTLHRVAAALVVITSGGSFGRRATVAAVQGTLASLQRELALAADAMGLLTVRLLLLMLSPGPRRVHLASLVNVDVAVVRRGLTLLVVGARASIDAPPEAWH